MDRLDVSVAFAAIVAGVIAGGLAAQPFAGTGPHAAPPRSASASPTRVLCQHRPGLAKPRSARVDPELDEELVGSIVEWPDDVDPRWTEADLTALLRDPRDVLHCDEWPCLLELHADDESPPPTGAALSAADTLVDLRARGWDVGHVQAVVRSRRHPDGHDESIVVMALRPADRDPTPAERHREAVRQFWLLESLQ